MASTDTELLNINFLPGFHRESTQYAEEGKWYDGNRVRFREGKPENLRGYNKYTDDAISGIARDIIVWTDNKTRKYQAFGTNRQLYVSQNEVRYDITPVASVVSVTGSNIETFNGSTKVKVDYGKTHGVSVVDRVVFTSLTEVNNVTLDGLFAITSVSGTDTFYVSAATTADADGTGGGSVGQIKLLLNSQPSDNIQGLGYGAGVYNANTSANSSIRAWNEAAEESNIIFLGAQWTLDTFGQDLLAQRRGGKIYYMELVDGQNPDRAVATSAPLANTFSVSPNDRHIVCYGTEILGSEGTIDPMHIRWSDQNSLDDWTPLSTNTAGSAFLTDGSRIRGVVRSRNTTNVWTDTAMYIQEFVGSPLIFRFTQVGSNCGLIGAHAAIDIDGVSYWMGENNFYFYDGRVNTMDCTIRRHLFEDFNMTNKDKVYAGSNSEFKEIIWLYPTADSTEPNSYVIYNYEENTWVYGKLFEEGNVTVFADRTVFENTIIIGNVSATADTFVYNNEPQDVYTGDGEHLSSFVESASFDLDKGKRIMFADKIIPDYEFSPGDEIQFFVNVKQYPSDDYTTKGPFRINSNTRNINLRARGRQASVRVSASNDGFWRWGSVRFAVQPDGER
jgi:hypothetical protein